MTRTLLPIGIQSFEKIRREGYLYVDKTPFILDLVQRGSYYFLSRPRRFGKSLFVDTLDCAFSGKADLFEGLTLAKPDSMWDFTRASPVLRIDFSGGTIRSADDLTGRLHRINSFFASIPHEWYRKNQLSGFEGYYASVVYAYFASLGYQVIAEDTTNRGRIDLTVITKNSIWVFEFKVQSSDGNKGKSPLAQIQEKRYAEKYRADGRPVIEVGVIFDPEIRNIVLWETGQ